MKKQATPLAVQIFIALVLGILAGIIFATTGTTQLATAYLQPIGTIFLNLLKFIVVPIVLTSIVAGVISMSDIRKVGSIGWKTILFYLSTTAFALVFGLLLSTLFRGHYQLLETTDLVYESAAATNLMDTLVAIFPSNPIAPILNASMLQVIVIALLIGFGILLSGDEGKPLADVILSASHVSTVILSLILRLSPVGVFCLIAPVVAVNGPQILGSLALVLLVAYLAYILHMTLVYSLAVRSFAKISPLAFFRGMMPAMIMAFSSSSSLGTLPMNMECVEKLGGKREVSSFVLPLGATINMDGTAIYQGVCAIFIAACYGITLTLPQLLTIVLTATLASIGTAGVPGAGMVMLAMVLQSVGLPVEGIALVAGIDRIFDMGRTTVNITGDAACALVVSHLESK